MARIDTNPHDAPTIALQALTFILNDPLRADRFVGVTGLTPDNLRGRLDDPAVLAAILAFLEAHEPDLIAAANMLGTTPAALVAARMTLETAA